MQESPDLLQKLLEKPVIATDENVDVLNKNGLTPLVVATILGNVEIVKKLIESRADPSIPVPSDIETVAGNISLVAALTGMGGNVDTLKRFVGIDAKLKVKDIAGNTPLHLATFSEDPRLL